MRLHGAYKKGEAVIHVAKQGDEELEARRQVSRRGFLRMLAGGAAAAAVPAKSYFFFGNIRPAPLPPWLFALGVAPVLLGMTPMLILAKR